MADGSAPPSPWKVYPVLFVAALVILPVLGGVTWAFSRSAMATTDAVARTTLLSSQVRRVVQQTLDVEAAVRAFAITSEERFLQPYEEGQVGLRETLARLRTALPDDRASQSRVDRLARLVERWLAHAGGVVALVRTGQAATVRELVGAGFDQSVTGAIGRLLEEFEAEERATLDERLISLAAQTRQTTALVVAGSVLATLFLAVAGHRARTELDRRQAAEAALAARHRALADQADRLVEANRELEAFSYSVSHDLRAPLRSLDGFSRILSEDYGDRLDDEGRRLIGILRGESRRMGQLIDDLLHFSRLGRQVLRPVEVDMVGLAREAFAEVVAVPGVTPPTLVVGTLPVVRGDRAMLRQVWANLIGNAVKFSARQPAPRIEIDGRLEAGRAIYTVRDNGVGFDQQYAHKLFGVFQRLHGESEFEGTGVGLALVQRIVHRHGGAVRAEGRRGEGASFEFALPVSAGERS